MTSSLRISATILFVILATSCEPQADNSTETPAKPLSEEPQQAFEANWEILNEEDLSDSLTFNKFLSFFADDFLTIGNEGNPTDDMQGTFNWLRGYLKQHKPNIDYTIDKVEATEDFAYFLFRYRESFRERETDTITIDVMHSSIMILRKNEAGIWKCVLWKFT